MFEAHEPQRPPRCLLGALEECEKLAAFPCLVQLCHLIRMFRTGVHHCSLSLSLSFSRVGFPQLLWDAHGSTPNAQVQCFAMWRYRARKRNTLPAKPRSATRGVVVALDTYTARCSLLFSAYSVLLSFCLSLPTKCRPDPDTPIEEDTKQEAKAAGVPPAATKH